MCGRYASTSSPDQLAIAFDAVDATGSDAPPADYNVAPTKPVFAVRAGRGAADGGVGAGRGAADGGVGAGRGARRLDVLSWGLVPSWARDRKIASRLLNARAESVTSLPAFRSAFARRRCLIPADGWYEWRRDPQGAGKQPYFLTPADGSVLAFAGLWETWTDEGSDTRVRTCTVVTTAAHGALAGIHDRMPLVLPPERWAAWLGESGEVPAEELLAPTPPEIVAAMEIRPVGPQVGNVKNNGPKLVTRCHTDGDTVPICTLF